MAITDPTDPLKAEVRITGEAPNQVLDFYIPKGGKGDKGDQGAPNVLTVLGTVTGPETPGATGPQGIQGLKGDPGGIVGTNITSGTDLNGFTASGLFTCGDGNFATLVLNYPLATKAGQLLVMRAHSNLIHQTYFVTDGPHFGRVQYHRTFNAGTWQPWRAYNSTRVDQTAGRVIYQWDDLNSREQIIYGDTGWRNVSTDLQSSMRGTLLLRRVGAVVSLRGEVQPPVGGTTHNGALYNVPTGFAGSQWAFFPVRCNSSSAIFSLYRRSPDILVEISPTVTDVSIMRFEISWTTTDTWPTTLPGVASGTTPNL